MCCAFPAFSMERLRKAGSELVYRCAKHYSAPSSDKRSDSHDLRVCGAQNLGSGDFAQHARWRFVNEEVFAVCSPAFLATNPQLQSPQDLANSTLLHLEERYRPRLDWSLWLARFGVSAARAGKALTFNDYSIVLQAALEGRGMALGWRHIVEPLIA